MPEHRLLDRVRAAIRVCQYSLATEKAYVDGLSALSCDPEEHCRRNIQKKRNPDRFRDRGFYEDAWQPERSGVAISERSEEEATTWSG